MNHLQCRLRNDECRLMQNAECRMQKYSDIFVLHASDFLLLPSDFLLLTSRRGPLEDKRIAKRLMAERRIEHDNDTLKTAALKSPANESQKSALENDIILMRRAVILSSRFIVFMRCLAINKMRSIINDDHIYRK